MKNILFIALLLFQLIFSTAFAQPDGFTLLGSVKGRNYYSAPKSMKDNSGESWLIYSNDEKNDFEFMVVSPKNCGYDLNARVSKNSSRDYILRNSTTEEWFKTIYDPLCLVIDKNKISPPLLPTLNYSKYSDYGVTRQGDLYHATVSKGHKLLINAYLDITRTVNKICTDNKLRPWIVRIDKNYSRENQSASALFTCMEYGTKIEDSIQADEFLLTAGMYGMYMALDVTDDSGSYRARPIMPTITKNFCKSMGKFSAPFPEINYSYPGVIKNGYGSSFYHFICY